jgi:hypothetical protein
MLTAFKMLYLCHGDSNEYFRFCAAATRFEQTVHAVSSHKAFIS